MISKNVQEMIPKIQQYLSSQPITKLGSLVHAHEGRRQRRVIISLQPSFQYIKNDNGDFTALSARLNVSF